MTITDEQKVYFGSNMLVEEVRHRWDNAHQTLEAWGTSITWTNLKREFLEKYLPKDVCNRKEVEFLELKQSNMNVVEYAKKFEELSRFFLHYNRVDAEGRKCVKFESGLHPEIK